MKTCPSQAELCAWLESGSEADTDSRIAAHLETCVSCQQVLERLTDIEGEGGPGGPPLAGSPADSAAALSRVLDPSLPGARGSSSEPGKGKLDRLRCLLSGETSAAAPAAPDLPAIAGYEILGELGRGGVGVVYKARQLNPRRLVALKTLRAGERATPDQVVRFGVESQTVARLQHPNIVQIYEVGVHQERPYFAMEFVDGGSLQERSAGRPQPPGEAAALVETLALAIHHAHERGVVHRDLKPANILLLESQEPRAESREPKGKKQAASGPLALDSRLSTLGFPKIADFGLARLMDTDLRLTQTGVAAGTPNYMSPEQASGQSLAIGPPADVWALGAILYELLTGWPPFMAATPLEVLRQVTDSDPVSPSVLVPGVPRDLETICLKCLRKEPAKRYSSAQTLAEDLGRFQDGRPVRARPLGPLGRSARWCRRNPFLAAALGVVAATVVVAFLWINGARRAAQTLAEDKDRLAQRNAELARKEQTARLQLEEALAKRTAALKERDEAARKAQAVNDYLIVGMLASTNPRNHQGKELTVRTVLDQAAAGVARAFAADPDREEVVRDMLGRAYVNLGQPREALTQFTARARLCRRLYGLTHRSTCDARVHRVTALRHCGDFATVVKECAELLPALRKVLGPEDALTLILRGEEAKARYQLGQEAEALKILEDLTAVRRRLRGPEHEDTLETQVTFATVLIISGRAAEGHKLCEQLLPLSRRQLGPEHPTTLALRNQRALGLMVLGRLEEAEKECEELLPVMRRTAGPGHLETLLVSSNLACVLMTRQRPSDACRLYDECLPPLRRLLGDGNLQVRAVAEHHGLCLLTLGKHAEAEALYEWLLPAQRRLTKAHDLSYLLNLSRYGVALQHRAKHGKAEAVWREVVEGRRKAYPPGHWKAGEAEAMLGASLAGLGRLKEAEAVLLAAHQHMTQAKGERAPDVIVRAVVQTLVRVYQAQGNPAQAAHWRARLQGGTVPAP
jgi:serine/threonine protein kinase/tetratricopeptide (TPR) repeat protein